jgi:alpha-L-fucosidase
MMQEWFKSAKLGIFIHWGIYAVNGIAESWSFYNGEISYEDYMKQLEGFTANKYNADEWAELFELAGAKYSILTTKHHDGVALWDTTLSDLSVVKKSPAARDLIKPYCDALREKGLKVGLYFSHLDWSHPGYASIRSRAEGLVCKYNSPEGPDDYEAWERFLQFHRGQLKELCTNYGKVDLLWFDGGWERTDEQWKMKELKDFLHSLNSEVILNSRVGEYGDYETPEQGVPIVRPEGVWEFCVTINDSWGYQHQDKNFKSVRQIVRMFAECIGMGGNLLLDIGPMADGTIIPEQKERLLALGEWIRSNEEAVYPTGAGLLPGHFYGPTTLSKDMKTLYLFQLDRPWDSISVKGLHNNIRKITVLSSGKELPFRKIGGAPWMNIPGVLWIDLDEKDMDPNCTVIKVELDGPLDLYRGAGHAIEKN